MSAADANAASILRPLVEDLHERRAKARLGGGQEKIDRQHAAEKLTAREREVLEQIARGASNKEIAQRLVIAENTVKVHLRNILDKLQVHSRAQAAAIAAQAGLTGRIRPGDDPADFSREDN